MRRKIVFSLAAFFLLLGIIAIGYKQLSSGGNAGYVIVGIGDWVLETSLYFVIIFLTLLFVSLYFGLRFLTGAAKLPDSIRKRNTEQRNKKSIDALQTGFIETIEGKSEKAERALIMHASDSSLPLINYLTAARAAHDRGAPEQREDYLKLARKTVPQADLAVGLSKARLLIDSHQYVEAVEQLVEINKTSRNHPVALRLMYEAFVQTKDWDALQNLIPVLREARLIPEAELRKLEVETYRSLLEKRALTRDAGLIREIWRLVPSHIRSDATVSAPYCRGMIDAGFGEEVEEDLRLSLGHQWNAVLLQLYSRIRLQDAARQLSSAEDWLGPHREDAGLLRLLSALALRANQTGKAIAYALQSLELEPSPEACKVLGDMLYERQDHVAASSVYHQGLRIVAGEQPDIAMIEKSASLLT